MAHVETLLEVDQGSPFEQSWQWGFSPDENSETFTPYNLTGWTAKCQIRAVPSLTGQVYAANVPITIDGPTGTITLSISDDMSLPWKWEFGFYDVVLIKPDGTPERFAEGKVILSKATTSVP